MKKYVVVVISLVLVLCVGVSYSYFTSNTNNKESKLKISSKDLSIVLTDNMELNSNDITPGWSDSKSFTIKNNSNGSYNYNIVLEGLVNTFVTEGFLQYKITSENGYNTESYINIPKSASPQDIVIGYDINIEKGITQEYQIEFIYKDSETVDQSEDMGKIFKGTLSIEEGTVNPNIKYSVTLNVENATLDENSKETIKKGSVEFNVTANEGYTLGTSVTCDNDATGVIENGKVTISNVTSNTICSLDNNINTYTIEMKVVNGKSNALNKIVEYNGTAEFEITPTYGYTLTNAALEGEGCVLEENNKVRVYNVKSNVTCKITLPRDKYQVILTGDNVEVTDSPKTVLYEGDTIFNVSPSTGFTLSNASVNCDGGASTSIDTTNNTITISNVIKGQTCTITPKQITYDVTLVVVNGTGNTTKSIAHGGSDTFNITVNSTYTLDNPTISCDGSASTSYSNGVLTVSNVTGKQTCTVTLKHTSYLVTVTSNNNNYGTVSPTSQYIVHGNNATITLSPKTGYEYSSNDCGGTVNSDNTKMTISNITAAKSCTVTFVAKRAVNEKFYTYLTNGEIYKLGDRGSFDTPFGGTSITQGYNQTRMIYKVETSEAQIDYYFAGNPSDNWVKFAGFWWRIIRTNSSEGTRLLYAGTTHNGQNGYINNTTYEWNYDVTVFSNSSWYNAANTMKNALTSWYNTHIIGTNANMINTNVEYCNDISGKDQNKQYVFGAASRLGKNPSFSCPQNGNDTHKNIGLITADELNFAGGISGQAPNTYFYRNSISSGCTGRINDLCSVVGDLSWWTMSPSYNWGGIARVFHVEIGSWVAGYLTDARVDNERVLRPVITLRPEAIVTGSGTTDDPYIPSMP